MECACVRVCEYIGTRVVVTVFFSIAAHAAICGNAKPEISPVRQIDR